MNLLSICIVYLKKAGRDQSGIGLAEALVAIAILGVSAVCFVSSLSAGAISTSTLQESMIAQRLLTSEMETLNSLQYDITGLSYPVISLPADYNLTLSVNSNIFSNTDLQKITAVVWHNGVQVAQLENYKSRW
jgi:hypothetical protein